MFEHELHTSIKACHKCRLRGTLPHGCTPVPGHGDLSAKLMCVGECPSVIELEKCQPFVGEAGSVLSRVLKAVGISRHDIYIANTINCWSRSGTRNIPVPDFAINACKPWLWQQIQLVNPKVIVTLGKVPTTLLLKITKKNYTLKHIIGVEHSVTWHTSTIVPCYHPSYVLRGNAAAFDSMIEVFRKVKEKI